MTINKSGFSRFRFKKLISKKKNSGGRNVTGKISVRHIGGASSSRKNYFSVIMGGGPVLADIGVFIATNYPSTRTCQVGLVRFSTGAYSYVLIPTGVRIGNLFCYTVSKEIELIKRKTKTCRVVYHTVFRLLPWPNVVFNLARRDVKYQVSKKSQIAKAAGTSCSLVEKDYVKERVFIGVPTGKRFWIS